MSFKVVSRTAETRTRSNETSFIKHVVILASALTVPCIIWENKTLKILLRAYILIIKRITKSLNMEVNN